jgi:hypothetical protein
LKDSIALLALACSGVLHSDEVTRRQQQMVVGLRARHGCRRDMPCQFMTKTTRLVFAPATSDLASSQALPFRILPNLVKSLSNSIVAPSSPLHRGCRAEGRIDGGDAFVRCSFQSCMACCSVTWGGGVHFTDVPIHPSIHPQITPPALLFAASPFR